MGKEQEPAGAWDVVEVEGEWEETAQAQGQREIASVLAVEQRFHIKQAFPAMI